MILLIAGLMQAQAPVVVEPGWLTRPTALEGIRYYPKRAAELGVTGRAIVLCRIAVDGRVISCTVREETPTGSGFGQATADLMTDVARFTPKTIDGRPVEGEVSMTMTFSKPGKRPAAPESATAQVSNADWEVQPTAEQLFRYFPNAAYQTWTPGRAVVKCIAATDHRVKDCVAVEESPPGKGFGAAAVELIQDHARMRPRTVDGVAVESEVVIPVPFSIPNRKLKPRRR